MRAEDDLPVRALTYADSSDRRACESDENVGVLEDNAEQLDGSGGREGASRLHAVAALRPAGVALRDSSRAGTRTG